MIVAKGFNTTPSPEVYDVIPNTQLYKNEDIPLSISASLQSLSRICVTKNNLGSVKEYEQNQHHHQHGNDNNEEGINYGYSNQAHRLHHVHCSTMNSNSRDYLRKPVVWYLHRNINNNNNNINSTIASTNRYRWHKESDEVALKSVEKAEDIRMHSSHRSNVHASNRNQHHLNQINNSFIVPNKKQSINKTNDDQHSDQTNGNNVSSSLHQ